MPVLRSLYVGWNLSEALPELRCDDSNISEPSREHPFLGVGSWNGAFPLP
jgi:hypothetical protein